MTRGHAYIGTSGWHYDHWIGPFYPEGAAGSALLDHYVRHFRTVEINNTFYHLPSRETLESWREQTPRGFRFAVKASRYITHMKKLTDPSRSVTRFFEVVDLLGAKLGPILFQLPPRWRANVDRLDEFLAALPSNRRYAFEFRDPSWFRPDVYRALRDHRAACCAYHLAGRRSPVALTSDFVYVRLHGPGRAYQGSYDGRTLSGWMRRMHRWCDEGRDVYCYFDNDQAGYAAKDAARLQAMLARRRS